MGISTTLYTNVHLGDSVIPKKGKSPALKIVQRYHFSSALKRMCVVVGYNIPGASETHYMAAVKGAPEILKNMVREIVISLIYSIIILAIFLCCHEYNFSCLLCRKIMIQLIYLSHDAARECSPWDIENFLVLFPLKI